MSARVASSEILERLAAGALAVAIVLGSLFLWIGVPVLGMWLAGELTTSAQGFLFATLGGIPPTMVAAGWLLYRLGGVYERLRPGAGGAPTGRSAWLVSQSDERSSQRRARAPRSLVDASMTASAVVALVLIVVWFFLIAEMQLAPMQ